MTIDRGDVAQKVETHLDELNRAKTRLCELASMPTTPNLTSPDPKTNERWDVGQIWAHLAEFGSYWLPQLQKITSTPPEIVEAFGRTKRDSHRIVMIENQRHIARSEHLAAIIQDMDRLADELAKLTPEDWACRGRHETLGEMTVDQFLHEFAIGHYHEHIAQLEEIHRG